MLVKNFGLQQVKAVLRFMCFRVCKVIFMGWLKIVIKLLFKDLACGKLLGVQLYVVSRRGFTIRMKV